MENFAKLEYLFDEGEDDIVEHRMRILSAFTSNFGLNLAKYSKKIFKVV